MPVTNSKVNLFVDGNNSLVFSNQKQLTMNGILIVVAHPSKV